MDAVTGEIKKKVLPFLILVSTKTIYNVVDRGDFCRITNKNLPIKLNKNKREHRNGIRLAQNSIKGGKYKRKRC